MASILEVKAQIPVLKIRLYSPDRSNPSTRLYAHMLDETSVQLTAPLYRPFTDNQNAYWVYTSDDIDSRLSTINSKIDNLEKSITNSLTNNINSKVNTTDSTLRNLILIACDTLPEKVFTHEQIKSLKDQLMMDLKKELKDGMTTIKNEILEEIRKRP